MGVEEVKAVVRKERKRKRRQAVKNAMGEVVEGEAVKVNVAGKAEAVKDVVDDVVRDDGIGLVDVDAGFVEAKGLAEGVEDGLDSFGSSFYSDVEDAARNVAVPSAVKDVVGGADGDYSGEYYSDDEPCVDAASQPLSSLLSSNRKRTGEGK